MNGRDVFVRTVDGLTDGCCITRREGKLTGPWMTAMAVEKTMNSVR